jgi:hypothetical protein
MAVEIQPGETFQAGVPREIFRPAVQPVANVRNHYLATADGQKFLVLSPLGREAMVPTTVVVNWNAGLSR